MKVSKAQQKACQVLRCKIRLTDASLTLPGNHWTEDNTNEIRQATKEYFHSWVEPIIDALERGDLRTLHCLCDHNRGIKMDEDNTNQGEG